MALRREPIAWGELVVLDLCVSLVEESIEISCLRIDFIDGGSGRQVYEFGDIDGAVGGGGVVDDDGGSVIAVGVDMGEHEPSKGSACLG